MWPVSSRFEAAVRGSHTVELRVDAYRGDTLLASDLPVDPESGTLTVDGASPVRRSVELTIADPALVPTAASSLLAPMSTELHISRGFRYPDGTVETIPIGVFRLSRPSTPLYGAVMITAVDRAKLVADDTFLGATTSTGGATHVSEITKWIRDSLGPDTPVDATSVSADEPLPTVTWEEGTPKLDAIAEMALAIDCEVYVDVEGTFIIRPIPRISATPAWTIDMGQTGVLVDGTEEWDRENIFNAVVVTSEPADGSPPIRAVSKDINRYSPTYWYGEFGHKPTRYTSPLIRSLAQAERTANTLLWRAIAPVRTVTLQTSPHAALEPGDVVAVHLPGTDVHHDVRREQHMVRGYTLPLGLGPMELDLYTPEPVV